MHAHEGRNGVIGFFLHRPVLASVCALFISPRSPVMRTADGEIVLTFADGSEPVRLSLPE